MDKEPKLRIGEPLHPLLISLGTFRRDGVCFGMAYTQGKRCQTNQSATRIRPCTTFVYHHCLFLVLGLNHPTF
jgi:hypothetical protein